MAAVEGYRPDLLKPLVAELAREEIPAEITVRGASMRPALDDGDRVRLVPITAAELRLGDVIARHGPEGPILHRLVGWWPIGGRRMLTMGDACRRLDFPAPPDQVIARAVERRRGDEVRRLDTGAARLAGRGRAALLLLRGLAVEAWDRVRGTRRATHA